MCKVPLRYTYRKLDYFRVTYEQCEPWLPLPLPISSLGFATMLKGEGSKRKQNRRSNAGANYDRYDHTAIDDIIRIIIYGIKQIVP